MSNKFSEIQTQFLTDLKLADMKYSTACAQHRVPITESVNSGLESLIKVAIANSFSYQTAIMVQNHKTDVDPNSVYPKEKFLADAERIYNGVHANCIKLVELVQAQLAVAEAKEAVKN